MNLAMPCMYALQNVFFFFFTIIFTVLFLDFFYYENNENIGNVKHFIYTAEIRNTTKNI